MALAPTAEQHHDSWLGWHALPHIALECPAFSGTLGVLLQCVRDRKIDVSGVPLAPLCHSFFEYVINQEPLDIDQASVALTALSYLIERKAGQILPKFEEQDRPDDDDLEVTHIDPTIALFAPALEVLVERRELREGLFFRPAEGQIQYELPLDLSDTTVHDLAMAFQRIMERAQPDPPPLGRPRRNMAEQIEIVLKQLTPEFRPLQSFFQEGYTRSDVVWWFLAILEILRLGQAELSFSDGEPLFARRARK